MINDQGELRRVTEGRHCRFEVADDGCTAEFEERLGGAHLGGPERWIGLCGPRALERWGRDAVQRARTE